MSVSLQVAESLSKCSFLSPLQMPCDFFFQNDPWPSFIFSLIFFQLLFLDPIPEPIHTNFILGATAPIPVSLKL